MAYPKRLFIGLDLSLANGWPNNQGGGSLAFTAQPQSAIVDEYSNASFSVTVTGGVAPYSYQWKKNGTNIGTNSAALSFATAATDNGASITCVVTDSVGSVIASDAAVLGVTSYVFSFDGLTQYAQLSSDVAIAAGDKISMIVGFGGATSSYRTIFDSQSATNRIAVRTLNGNWDIIGGTLVVNGVLVANGSAAPVSGYHAIEFTSAGLGSVRYISNNYAFSAYGQFKIRGVTLVRAAGNITIPLNNKSQGANQLATVGSINATIVNYSANGWVAI